MTEKKSNTVKQYRAKFVSLTAFRSAVVITFCALTITVSSADSTDNRLDPTNILMFAVQPEPNVSEKTEPAPTVELVHLPALLKEATDNRRTKDATAPLQSQANLDSLLQQQPSSEIPEDTAKSDTKPERELIKVSISSVCEPQENENSDLLKQLINQVNSVQLDAKSQPEPVETKPESIPENTEPQITAEQSQQQQEVQTKETISKETAEKLERLMKNSAGVKQAFMLGELLYLSGDYEKAAYFYDKAVNDDSQTNQLRADDQDWLLMQMAACLKDQKPAEAIETYKRLISQNPDSQWTELAKTREQLVEWIANEQPGELIKKCRAELNSK